MIARLALTALGPEDGAEEGQRSGSTDHPQDGKQTPNERRSSNRRVLVVEDDYLVGLTICDLLAGAGYTVIGPAVTGEEAVGLAVEDCPDIVLMDISLAGEMDGVEAAVEIARVGTRLLFVSAHSDPQTRARGSAVSPQGWVEKPFSEAQLLEAVAAALR